MAQELYLKLISINDKYINAYINFGNLKRDLNEFSSQLSFMRKKPFLSTKKKSNYKLSISTCKSGNCNFEKAILYSEKALKYDKNFSSRSFN